jgi:hypothetical protein
LNWWCVATTLFAREKSNFGLKVWWSRWHVHRCRLT